MAKGQYLSGYQQGIVKRYYDNQDGLVLGKLAELVSELYVCEDSKKAASLWKSVQAGLKKSNVDALRAARIINEKRIEDLAKLVQELSKPGAQVVADRPRAESSVPSSTSIPKAGAAVAAGAEAAPPTAAADSASATTGLPPSAPAGPSFDELKRALHAFKKKLKLTKLDAESKLSARALTGGRSSGIVAVEPPREFSRAVWDELVKQGKMRRSGAGMYELVDAP